MSVIAVVLVIAGIFWLPAMFGLALVVGRTIKARDKQVPR